MSITDQHILVTVQQLIDIQNIELLEILHANNSLNDEYFKWIHKNARVITTDNVSLSQLVTTENGLIHPIYQLLYFLFKEEESVEKNYHGIERTEQESELRLQQLEYIIQKYPTQEKYANFLLHQAKKMNASHYWVTICEEAVKNKLPICAIMDFL